MTACSGLDVTPASGDGIPACLPATNLLVGTHGGRYLARTPLHQELEGSEHEAAIRIAFAWPSTEAAARPTAGPGYRAPRLDPTGEHHA